VSTGAIRNSRLLALAGTTSSLKIILKVSAKGWAKAIGPPIRFGPRRVCIQPMTLRSASV
jgi:hypothetical protein